MTEAEKERAAVDNPPAFPTDGRIQHGTPYDGMSLRDWFAGQALTGVIARLDKVAYNGSVDNDDWSCEAGDAYRIADAMLYARTEHLKEGR